VAFYATIITTLGILALVAVALALGLGVALAAAGGRARLTDALGGLERHPIGWAWLVALIAMLGSLYLSDIVHFAPCLLCWYQRIAMYPLVFVLGVGILRADAGVWRYAIPMPVIGFVISAYHVLIQWRPNLEVTTCAVGAPCTGRYVAVFGFISIPTMAGAAFLLITALMLLLRAVEREGSAPEAL
jgi:disulfide bond formation protein DsbB